MWIPIPTPRPHPHPIPIRHPNPNSYSDLWILAAYVGIEHTGGPAIEFTPGRTDHADESYWAAMKARPAYPQPYPYPYPCPYYPYPYP